MKQLHAKHRIMPDHEKPGVPLHEYIVTKVVNATLPHIDSILDTNAIEAYCQAEEWTVTIT